MELNRCSRCGSFYVAEGNVCPRCSAKDGFEFQTFKTYIQENGFENSIDTISGETGISTKNLNRFLGYQEFKDLKKEFGFNNIAEFNEGNTSSNNGIIFNG